MFTRSATRYKSGLKDNASVLQSRCIEAVQSPTCRGKKHGGANLALSLFMGEYSTITKSCHVTYLCEAKAMNIGQIVR